MLPYRSDRSVIDQKKQILAHTKKWSAIILLLMVIFPPFLIYNRERSLATKLGCDLTQERLTPNCSIANDSINKGTHLSFMLFSIFSLLLASYTYFLILEIQNHIETLEKYEKAKEEENC